MNRLPATSGGRVPSLARLQAASTAFLLALIFSGIARATGGVAVQVTATAVAAASGSTATLGLSSTLLSGINSADSNNVLIIGIGIVSSNNTARTVSGLTWNGSTSTYGTTSAISGCQTTKAGSGSGGSATKGTTVAFWKIPAPALPSSGTWNIVVTSSGTGYIIVDASLISGASVGTCPTGVTAAGPATVTTGTITAPGSSGLVLSVFANAKTGTVPTYGAGQTQLWEAANATNAMTVVTTQAGTATSASFKYVAPGTTAAANILPLTSNAVTAVTVSSLTVTRSGAGNLIRLQTGREVGNIGFNIYREQNGQRVKLNRSLLAGSALMGGAGTTFTAGHTRTWQDDLPGKSGSAAYWVQEIDVRGARTWYGPVYPEEPQPAAQRTGPSPTLMRTGAPSSSSTAVSLASIGRTAAAAVTSALPSLSATPKDSQTQFSLASRQAIKIGVAAEGWYRVPAAQLTAAGLDPRVNPSSLHLYVNGAEQPVEVETSAQNQLQAIDFYGQPIDTVWSGTQQYWLVSGQPFGLRMLTAQTRTAAPANGPGFPFSVLWKPRTLYFAALLNGDGNNFFGPAITSTDSINQNIAVSNLNAASASTSELQVTLQGATAGPHSVSVSLNGNAVGNLSFNDMTNFTSTFEIPVSDLAEGTNTLTLAVTGSATDVSVVDHAVLTYPHLYAADNNFLRLSANAGSQIAVGGFTDTSVQVIDVTEPSYPILVPSRISAGTATFLVPGIGTRTLLAVGASQFASPAAITATQASAWHAAQQGGDMVIVTHSSLIPALAPLVALRQSQGHTVKVVDVADLYNEFSYGVETPYAIREFLASASSNWQTPPAFVLLAGNGTFDPRNYLQSTVPDLVPAKLVDTALLETASDDWFADFNDDGIPEMAVGRIPAENAAEAANAVNRLIAYDQSGTGGWKARALFVAGADTDPTDSFESDAAAVQALAPQTVTTSSLLAGTDANARANLLAAIGNGVSLINYTGHGSNEIWEGGLLSSSDALALTNGGMAPFVLSMTCLNGYFQDVYTDPLGKALLNATDGGAVAVWASSGLTDASPQSNLDQAMVTALYGTPGIAIGQAARLAKAATPDPDVRRTWNLLGDPSMKLQ